nr:beta-carotene 15,15'-monooxygenase [Cytophagales bacterium]
MKRIEGIGKGTGILVGIAYSISEYQSESFLWAWFILLMVTLGIPHGAIDHLLYQENQGKKQNLKTFILIYLGIMLVYLLCWYFYPIAALVLFIGMSAYHFGQSHFISVPATSKKQLLYLSMGCFYLSVILFGDFNQTREILLNLVDIQFINPWTTPIIGSFFLTSSLLVLLQKTPKKYGFIIEMIVLGFCLYYMPLLLGFITYFCFWHALPSMMEEYYKLSFAKENNGLLFVKSLLPFSLISIIGIAFILVVFNQWLAEKDITLLFFIMVSLISAPHIWIMNLFLESTPKQPARPS